MATANKKPVKAKIIVLGSKEDPIEVLFNPSEYSLEKSNKFTWDEVQGTTSPAGHFHSGGSTTLNVELFFDTYEKGTDVRVHTGKIAGLLERKKKAIAPPVCQFVWDKLLFKGIVEKVQQTFTMFLESGVPVRAKVKVTFRSWTTPAEQQAEAQAVAQQTRRTMMKQGEQLWQVASDEYKDPSQWRRIAKANNINNPSRPPSGRNITVPSRKRR